MKIKSLFAAVIASAMAFVACEQEKIDLGTPSIALSLEEVTLEAAGGEATVYVTATRDWTVTFDETADWLVVDPASGTASADAQQVTVSALSNEGYDREVSVKFAIEMQPKSLKVKQAGAKGAPAVIDGDGTEASPYSASKANELASALGENDKKSGVYVQGIVKEIKEVNTQFGNATYYITDEVGSVKFYVFRGNYLAGAKFTAENQIKVGDNVVIYGDLMNYKGNSPQLGQGNYIVKLNGTGSTGGENTEIDGLECTVKEADKAYVQSATVNGESVRVVKLGTSSAAGKATMTVPAGSEKLTFYAVSWKSKPASLKLSAGGTEIKTISPAANDGASDTPPYTMTVVDSDKFEVDIPENVTEILFETTGSNTRVIIFNIVAE